MFWRIWDTYIIPLLLIYAGTYLLLLATGILKIKNPKVRENWERRYRLLSMIFGPLAILGGIYYHFLAR